MWSRTVHTLSPRSAAIPLGLRPTSSRSSTCRSRGDSPGGAAGGRARWPSRTSRPTSPTANRITARSRPVGGRSPPNACSASPSARSPSSRAQWTIDSVSFPAVRQSWLWAYRRSAARSGNTWATDSSSVDDASQIDRSANASASGGSLPNTSAIYLAYTASHSPPAVTWEKWADPPGRHWSPTTSTPCRTPISRPRPSISRCRCPGGSPLRAATSTIKCSTSSTCPDVG